MSYYPYGANASQENYSCDVNYQANKYPTHASNQQLANYTQPASSVYYPQYNVPPPACISVSLPSVDTSLPPPSVSGSLPPPSVNSSIHPSHVNNSLSSSINSYANTNRYPSYNQIPHNSSIAYSVPSLPQFPYVPQTQNASSESVRPTEKPSVDEYFQSTFSAKSSSSYRRNRDSRSDVGYSRHKVSDRSHSPSHSSLSSSSTNYYKGSKLSDRSYSSRSSTYSYKKEAKERSYRSPEKKYSPSKETEKRRSKTKENDAPKRKRRKVKRNEEMDERYQFLKPKYDGVENKSQLDEDAACNGDKSDYEDMKFIDFEDIKASWSRSSPAELFYERCTSNPSIVKATKRCKKNCDIFYEKTIKNATIAKEENKLRMEKYDEQTGKVVGPENDCCHKIKQCTGHSNDSSSDDSSSDSDDDDWVTRGAEEMEKKQSHPDRLHPELWFNDIGEMNDGPLCRCSAKAKRYGIRHGYYAGESPLDKCDQWTNNADKLYHYLITISPPTNFLVKTPTVIMHDEHEFIFEGFSLFSHYPLPTLPTCQVIRFNIEYSIIYIEEKFPENFCIQELNLFSDLFYTEILELVDLNFKAVKDESGCPRYHFMPRFVRSLSDNGKEVLSMNEVLSYIIRSYLPLVEPESLSELLSRSEHEWLNYTDEVKGMIVTYPGKKPSSIRVDQLDRDQQAKKVISYPIIVHFGIRPPQLSYAGNPAYQKALREYVKFRHLLANMPKPSPQDKRNLASKEAQLQKMRMASKMKKDVTVAVSSQGFYRTGLMCDIVQHSLLLPVLVRHLRFHKSCDALEDTINYKFKNRYLLQLALTHPSYRENFGTNPDHARNSLTNCGIRQPEYGDRRIHYMNTHKRGINTLINIMSRFGHKEESESKITHNERLEFLGDSVVEFLTSIHLFHLFPNLEEGGLATYRAAIVQNQQLSVLAEKLHLEQFVLHAHGSDLCHTFELKHAVANCFEALMGAIFIDSGIEDSDAVFSATLFKCEEEQYQIWIDYKLHPLQEQEPQGDRKWIETYPILQKLVKFEEEIGITFRHVRLLARSFTDRSIGFNYLTLGSNQRLEFLGDTVLQLVASEYLYRFFPEHHEGHLSLLRSSLVNNRTQAVVCDDLGMTKYAMYSHLKTELKTKDRADLLEAFLGALYIDRGLDFCRVFCSVCFFPRLQQFIINQNWNDPKSKLQQCCLTLRTMEGGEPDIPIYKVIECKGPTNTRVYTVAVYFRNKRLAKASGHSIQQAEMNSALEALKNHKDLFPHLEYQKRVIEKNSKVQEPGRNDMPSTTRKHDGSKSRSYKRHGSSHAGYTSRRHSRYDDDNASKKYSGSSSKK